MSYRIAKLGLGGVLDQGVAIIRNHFGLLLGIMAVVFIPYHLVTGLIEVEMIPQLPANPTMEDVSAVQDAQLANWPYFAATYALAWLVVIPLTNAAVIDAVARLYLGKNTTAIGSMKRGLRKIGPLVWTSLLVGLAVMGGFFLCIIPGILFGLWFGLAHQVVIVEGISGPAALGRSKMLVRPYLGQFLVLGLLVFVISFMLGLAAGLVPQPHIQAIVIAMLQAVTTILGTAVFVVFYFSCRCGVENFDLEHLAESIGRTDEEVAAGGVDLDVAP